MKVKIISPTECQDESACKTYRIEFQPCVCYLTPFPLNGCRQTCTDKLKRGQVYNATLISEGVVKIID